MASKELIDSRSSLEKKRAVKEESLQSHLQNYINDVSTRRSLVAATSDLSESVDAFLASFSHSCDQVEDRLASIRSEKSIEVDEARLESVREELKSLLLEISNMETMVANSSFYLPTYSIQSSQTSFIKLEEVEAAMAELLPKKYSLSVAKLQNQQRRTKRCSQLYLLLLVIANLVALCRAFMVSRINNTAPLHDTHRIYKTEYMLANLINCRVYLIGKCRALHVNKLRDCQVCTGPVTGSVLIDDVEGSILMLVSQQIRIQSSKNTSFVRFAPNAFHYPGAEDALQDANLQEETDDFRWLRAVQSPKWSILPSIERISIDATDVIEKPTAGNT